MGTAVHRLAGCLAGDGEVRKVAVERVVARVCLAGDGEVRNVAVDRLVGQCVPWKKAG